MATVSCVYTLILCLIVSPVHKLNWSVLNADQVIVCHWSHLVSFRLLTHMTNDVNEGSQNSGKRSSHTGYWLACFRFLMCQWPIYTNISHNRTNGNIENTHFINSPTQFDLFEWNLHLFLDFLSEKKQRFQRLHFHLDRSTHLRRFLNVLIFGDRQIVVRVSRLLEWSCRGFRRGLTTSIYITMRKWKDLCLSE